MEDHVSRKRKFLRHSKGRQDLYNREMKTYIPRKGETKKKLKDLNAYKRLPSVFLLFFFQIKREYPCIPIGNVAKKLGETWNSIPVDDKQLYEKKAAKMKKKYGAKKIVIKAEKKEEEEKEVEDDNKK